MRQFLVGHNPTLLDLYRVGGVVTLVGVTLGIFAMECLALYLLNHLIDRRRSTRRARSA